MGGRLRETATLRRSLNTGADFIKITLLLRIKICALWSALLEGETWLTKIRKYQHHRHGPRAEGRMVRDPIVDPAAARAGDANFSDARKSVSSAWRKLTTLITKTCVCSASLWRSEA